ncbi:MAG: AAA family ATPase [Candidatus Paceibacterota bacterium]
MRLKHIEISGFKSFAKKATLSFTAPVTSVVGPNGSGKSNVVESFRFVLGEQSMKSMRGKSGADLIFKGGTNAPKLSRAAVSITFDNTDKVFNFGAPQSSTEATSAPLLFDEVTFTRELYADGTSRYLMNGTEIRLKQMVELLSSVNIGTSSHHIISQGEADGILRASSRDRREMLEDALGLKIYHFRIKESESKLTKATNTLKEVQSLRRELAPHLTFLKKQVEKVEKGRAIREELEMLSLQYLATERAKLREEDNRLAQAYSLIASKKTQLEQLLATIPAEDVVHDSTAGERSNITSQLQIIREKRRTTESRISRLEGMVEAQRQMIIAQSKQQQFIAKAITFSPDEYQALLNDIDQVLQHIRNADSLEVVKASLAKIESLVSRLKDRQEKRPTQIEQPSIDTGISDTALELEDLERELRAYIGQEEALQQQLQAAEQARDVAMMASQTATRKRYEVISDIKQSEAEIQILEVSKSGFLDRKEQFDIELKEAGFMFGVGFTQKFAAAQAIPEFDLHTQKRTIDRLKIRLDEHAGIGNEVVTEYESTFERDAFLAREVTDIESGVRNLETLIIDLKRVLDEQFTSGVKVINERFSDFFKTMFGGGSAFLSITLEKKRRRKNIDEQIAAEGEDPEQSEEEEEFERGIEVHVNLPEKKVKELNMLSGGERSLVSIALLFAISQVNPPPFLVLDETDAALDEANSRRYGDMIELLSQYSQLIVVTHNRETMSRASVLYGVTLGTDGGSKLLSIKFDEAVKVAK